MSKEHKKSDEYWNEYLEYNSNSCAKFTKIINLQKYRSVEHKKQLLLGVLGKHDASLYASYSAGRRHPEIKFRTEQALDALSNYQNDTEVEQGWIGPESVYLMLSLAYLTDVDAKLVQPLKEYTARFKFYDPIWNALFKAIGLKISSKTKNPIWPNVNGGVKSCHVAV